jgi:hypothetical protein
MYEGGRGGWGWGGDGDGVGVGGVGGLGTLIRIPLLCAQKGLEM